MHNFSNLAIFLCHKSVKNTNFCRSVLPVATAKDRIFARDRSAIYTSVILIASGRSAIYPYGNVFLLEIDRRSTAKDSCFARGRLPIFLLPFFANGRSAIYLQ